MGRLTERIASARRAVASLHELSEKGQLTLVERDALVQRFEYSVEAVWKAAQLFLREVEGIDVGSPKAAARAALQVGVLTDEETRAALPARGIHARARLPAGGNLAFADHALALAAGDPAARADALRERIRLAHHRGDAALIDALLPAAIHADPALRAAPRLAEALGE